LNGRYQASWIVTRTTAIGALADRPLSSPEPAGRLPGESSDSAAAERIGLVESDPSGFGVVFQKAAFGADTMNRDYTAIVKYSRLCELILLAALASCGTQESATISSINKFQNNGEFRVVIGVRTDDGMLGAITYVGDVAAAENCHEGDRVRVREVGLTIEPVGSPCIPQGAD
jgi:hypothetical protein